MGAYTESFGWCACVYTCDGVRGQYARLFEMFGGTEMLGE